MGVEEKGNKEKLSSQIMFNTQRGWERSEKEESRRKALSLFAELKVTSWPN